MQNRIKLFLFALFTPLLCGVSFATTPDLVYFTDIPYSDLNNFDESFINSSSLDDFNNMCIVFHGLASSSVGGITANIRYEIQGTRGGFNSSLDTPIIDNSVYCFPLYRYNQDSNTNRQTVFVRSYYNDFYVQCPLCSQVNPNGYISVYKVNSLPNTFGDCSSIEDQLSSCQSNYNTLSGSYNTCLNTLNSCNGQVGTLSGQLSTCSSNLASCTNSCDTLVAQCTENLSGCTADLSSMTNYKDSLEDQLQQCLAEIPVPCTGTGCDEVSTGINAVFSFFWERDDNMFSLPISNNIFLPRGITAYIDSGVVALAEEEKQKIKIDQGFEVLTGTYYHFFIGIVMLGIFCLFAYYVKKFISKSFIPKEK